MTRSVTMRRIHGSRLVLAVLASGCSYLLGCGDQPPTGTGGMGAGGSTGSTTTSSGGAGAGVCTPDTKQCSGNTPQTCDATGSWQNEAACPYVCSAGTCTGTCVPGSRQCSGNMPQTCDATGSWQNEAACPLNCSEGVCTGSCTPGEKRCSGLGAQTCDANGIWQTTATCTYVCSAGACIGSCTPGSGQCNGLVPQTCDATGEWQSGATCSGATPFCSAGACSATQPGCQTGAPGAGTDCGPSSNESCCAALPVNGGSFFRSYDGVTYTDQSYPATVGSLKLDKYEVTVGRFRQFVKAWVGGWRPAAATGKHGYLNGGSGLANVGGAGTYETGWDTVWAANLATTDAGWDTNLHASGFRATWTSSAGSNETLPINYVTWHEAYAFCIWDGGFLPTEAEWNYASAGGDEHRPYPWGASVPAADATLAVYGCYYGGSGTCSLDVTNIAPVGSAAAGVGRYGQADLAGNVFEWTLDWDGNYSTPCVDCANVGNATLRVARGGSFDFGDTGLFTSFRYGRTPGSRDYGIGLRCARNP